MTEPFIQQTRSTVRRMIVVLALFILISFLTLSFLVQRGAVYAHTLCEQRQAGVARNNATWQRLIASERTNHFIDDKLRDERIQIYLDAQQPTPECTQ